MRIPSGKTDQLIYFVAVDATDLKTRETGLSSFTVYRSRNGGAATAYTTPTVSELSAANMPGVYALTVDEDTTIASTSDSEEYCVHITQASMAPVTRTIELYRRDTTSGQTITVANGAADADIERLQGSVIATPTVAGVLEVDLTHIAGAAVSTSSAQLGVNVVNVGGTAQTAGDIIADTNDIQSRLPAALTVDGNIKADTLRVGGTLQTAGDIIGDTNDIQTRLPAALVGGRMDSSVGAMAAGVVTAAAVATGAIDADAIAADAVTEIQSGLSTLDAAGVRAAVGLASANLDTQLTAIDDFLDTEVAAIKTQTDKLTFTVANQVDANIQYVNDVQVNGTGAAGNEWGP